jgi:hypothetical protein
LSMPDCGASQTRSPVPNSRPCSWPLSRAPDSQSGRHALRIKGLRHFSNFRAQPGRNYPQK